MINIVLRSLIFNILFIFWTLVVCIIFIPQLLFVKDLAFVGRVWGHGTSLMLKYICNITYVLEGKENIAEPSIIASKHQSAWETAIFHIIFPRPIYILKKELYYIPLYGIFLKKMGMIGINRSSGIGAIKEINRKVKSSIDEGRVIVIYPEGTRTPYLHKANIKPGIISLYQSNMAPIIPVSLDSGKCWGKSAFIKKPGIIKVKIFPPIEHGLEKQEFQKLLSQQIDELNAKAEE